MLGLTPGFAQVATNMTVKIPFDFVAGRSTFTAGEYDIRSIGSNTILVRSTSQTRAAMVMTYADMKLKAPEQSTLVFNKYGNRYFLRSAWTGGDRYGRLLMESPAERETERAGAPRVLAYVRAAH